MIVRVSGFFSGSGASGAPLADAFGFVLVLLVSVAAAGFAFLGGLSEFEKTMKLLSSSVVFAAAGFLPFAPWRGG